MYGNMKEDGISFSFETFIYRQVNDVEWFY